MCCIVLGPGRIFYLSIERILVRIGPLSSDSLVVSSRPFTWKKREKALAEQTNWYLKSTTVKLETTTPDDPFDRVIRMSFCPLFRPWLPHKLICLLESSSLPLVRQ